MKNNFILKNKKWQEWHFFTFLKSSLVSGLLEDAGSHMFRLLRCIVLVGAHEDVKPHLIYVAVKKVTKYLLQIILDFFDIISQHNKW